MKLLQVIRQVLPLTAKSSLHMLRTHSIVLSRFQAFNFSKHQNHIFKREANIDNLVVLKKIIAQINQLDETQFGQAANSLLDMAFSDRISQEMFKESLLTEFIKKHTESYVNSQLTYIQKELGLHFEAVNNGNMNEGKDHLDSINLKYEKGMKCLKLYEPKAQIRYIRITFNKSFADFNANVIQIRSQQKIKRDVTQFTIKVYKSVVMETNEEIQTFVQTIKKQIKDNIKSTESQKSKQEFRLKIKERLNLHLWKFVDIHSQSVIQILDLYKQIGNEMATQNEPFDAYTACVTLLPQFQLALDYYAILNNRNLSQYYHLIKTFKMSLTLNQAFKAYSDMSESKRQSFFTEFQVTFIAEANEFLEEIIRNLKQIQKVRTGRDILIGVLQAYMSTLDFAMMSYTSDRKLFEPELRKFMSRFALEIENEEERAFIREKIRNSEQQILNSLL